MIDVPTRDHAFLNPTGRLVVVFTDDDGARVLDVALVTAIDWRTDIKGKAPKVALGDGRRRSFNYGSNGSQGYSDNGGR